MLQKCIMSPPTTAGSAGADSKQVNTNVIISFQSFNYGLGICFQSPFLLPPLLFTSETVLHWEHWGLWPLQLAYLGSHLPTLSHEVTYHRLKTLPLAVSGRLRSELLDVLSLKALCLEGSNFFVYYLKMFNYTMDAVLDVQFIYPDMYLLST